MPRLALTAVIAGALSIASPWAQERSASDFYRKWLNEDVVYIITPEERAVFNSLQTPEERDSFIEQFWGRRDPSPGRPHNEARAEHYRRLAYVDEKFTAGIPGWRTDRGRIYIIHGPPDHIESHPGGTYLRPYHEGGGQTSALPFEKWWYRHLDGIGDGIEIEFVDDKGGGLYELTQDPNRKDAFLYAPNAGLTDLEAVGALKKDDRILGRRGSKETIEDIDPFQRIQDRPLEKLLTTARLNRPPQLRFKELAESVTAKVRYNTLPFDLSTEMLRVGAGDALVPLTVQLRNSDLGYGQEGGARHNTVRLYGRVTTLSGKIVGEFEDEIRSSIPDAEFEETRGGRSIYQRPMVLSPGVYKLDLVLRDTTTERTGTTEARLEVPAGGGDALSLSSVMLAEAIAAAPAADAESVEQFVFGGLKVTPRVDRTFRSEEPLGLYVQLYDPPRDVATGRLLAVVEMAIVGSGQTAAATVWQDVTRSVRPAGNRWALARMMSLRDYAPGHYRVLIRAADPATGTARTAEGAFTVLP